MIFHTDDGVTLHQTKPEAIAAARWMQKRGTFGRYCVAVPAK